MTREAFRQRFYLPYAGFYREIFPETPLSDLENCFRKGFSQAEQAGHSMHLIQHALAILNYLHSHHKRIFLLSSIDPPAYEKYAEKLHIAHFFEYAYAGVLDKVAAIHQILKKHQLAKHSTVFLGDMTHDIHAAHHGGILSVGLLTGYQDAFRLQSAQPDFLLENLSSLYGLFG